MKMDYQELRVLARLVRELDAAWSEDSSIRGASETPEALEARVKLANALGRLNGQMIVLGLKESAPNSDQVEQEKAVAQSTRGPQ